MKLWWMGDFSIYDEVLSYAAPSCVYYPEIIEDNAHGLKSKIAMTDILVINKKYIFAAHMTERK